MEETSPHLLWISGNNEKINLVSQDLSNVSSFVSCHWPETHPITPLSSKHTFDFSVHLVAYYDFLVQLSSLYSSAGTFAFTETWFCINLSWLCIMSIKCSGKLKHFWDLHKKGIQALAYKCFFFGKHFLNSKNVLHCFILEIRINSLQPLARSSI